MITDKDRKLMALQIERGVRGSMQRINQRLIRYHARLRKAEIERLVSLVRLQERQIEEWRDRCAIADQRHEELWDQFEDWYYYSDAVDPKAIYEFFDEIGIDPCDLPNRLSDIIALRDFVKAVQS